MTDANQDPSVLPSMPQYPAYPPTGQPQWPAQAYPPPPVGYPQQPYSYGPPPGHGYPAGPPSGTNGMAITGFVLSFFCSILGLIFSVIGMNQTKQTGQSGRGLAVAGLVISIVSLAFGLIWFIAVGAASNS